MPQNLKPLTALRFFAAIWVVGFHYWPHLTAAPMPVWQAKGYLGVELFFVLSGFILSHVYLEAHGTGRFSYRSFIWARLARIYPLHLLTLAGVGLLALAAAVIGLDLGGKVLIWSSLPAELTLTHAWGLGQGGGWNHPSWSISAEWFAYLTFPLFAWAAWRMRARPWLAAGLALVLVFAMDVGFRAWTGQLLTLQTLTFGFLRIVPCFAYGAAAYLIWRTRPIRTERTALATTAASTLAVIAAAALGAPDPVMVALFGPLILSLGALSSTGSRLLTQSVWVWLGEVSFAVYMVCIPWLLVFGKLADRLLHLEGGPMPWPLWALMFAGVVPVAALAHHLVELPARTAMRRWEARRRVRSRPAEALEAAPASAA